MIDFNSFGLSLHDKNDNGDRNLLNTYYNYEGLKKYSPW